jgi:hypothetical protein
MVPEGEGDTGGRLSLHGLGTPPFTTVRFRVFEPNDEGKPILVQRLDRDLPKDRHEINADAQRVLKDLRPDVTIIADFNKGAISKEVVDALPSGTRILRPKRTMAETKALGLSRVEWLLPNLEDLANLTPDDPDSNGDGGSKRLRRRGEPLPRVVLAKNSKGEILLAPAFIEALEDAKRMTDNLVVKLGADGALLVEDKRVTLFRTPDHVREKSPAIGAGDFLIAALAVELSKGTTSADAASAAVQRATAYCKQQIEFPFPGRSGRWYGTRMSGLKAGVAPDRHHATMGRLKSDSLGTPPISGLADLTRSAFDPARGDTIELADAGWFLTGFDTTCQELGASIASLSRQIAAYATAMREVPTDDPRPFVAAILGPPGSGKSTLANALAKESDCEYIEANVAQWASIDDLFTMLEKIRTVALRRKVPLVLIDEVDTNHSTDPIYGKLLAPLWDRHYFFRGEQRRIGPAIFLLAGSSNIWQREELLMKAEFPKLPDLVSRFSAKPITLFDLERERRGDIAYMVVRKLRERFPMVEFFDRSLLGLFMKDPSSKDRVLKHGARSIELAIALLGSPENPREVTGKDVEKLLKHPSLKMHVEPGSATHTGSGLVTIIA